MVVERRGFLLYVGRALGVVTGFVLLLVGGLVSRPVRVRDLSRRVRLGSVESFPLGTRLHLPAHDVYLFHDTGGLVAFSGRCTHLGCSLRLYPEGFACPCHGARFGLDGKPVSGPARIPLRRLGLEVEGGVLFLDLDGGPVA